MHKLIQTHSFTLGFAAATATLLAVGACSSKSNQTYSAAGSVDTTSNPTTAVTTSAGPGAQVTATDGASVNKATEYKLTDDNFQHFMAAADSVVVLAGRDSAARAFLATDITGSSSKDVDAGLKWLESNAAVNNAINSAGISTRDYFVASIAIADAEQFINAPKSAPATPTGTSNAEFLRSHTADLDHLRSLTTKQPSVTVTP
ncbi:MAG TPA: hypothetical protein VGM67_15525 [Gemmatimonadaceae bacterium]